MELKTPKIPEEFIETLPEGMKFVHKHGRECLERCSKPIG